VTITTDPMNMTLCLTQRNIAEFTCVVNTMGSPIFHISWIIWDGCFFPTSGRPHHSDLSDRSGNITNSTLRVINVTMNDNGAEYRCEPESLVVSNSAFLTVLGEIIIISSINA